METNGRENIKLIAILAILGGGAYLLAQKLGLIKTAAEKQQAEDAMKLTVGASGNAAVLDTKNPTLSLNPKYWIAIINKWKKDNKKTGVTIKDLETLFNPLPGNGKSYNVNLAALTDTVYNSKKIWFRPDTEDKTFGIFRSLKSQAQISKLADNMLSYHDTDLLDYIKSYFNDEQLSELYEIISSKPLL